jgi:tripartite-type tricarboxylate transporter receptor subunit TctC
MRQVQFSVQSFLIKLMAILVIPMVGMGNSYAQTPWPNAQTIRFIVPFTPGSGTDVVARLIANKVADSLGTSIFIENKPGAGGTIGAALVAKSAPDGYTFLVSASAPMSINPHIYKSLSYSPLTDFTPIGMLVWLPYLMVVNPNDPANTLQQFLANAQKSPTPISYGSTGNGATSNLVMSVLAKRANIEMTQVPYKGSSQAQADVIGGQLPVTFDTLSSSIAMVKAGKLKPLAVATLKRTELAPEIPTVVEQGFPGFEIGAWLGLFGPVGLPPVVQKTLLTEINLILQEPETRAKLAKGGAEVRSSSSSGEFVVFLKNDYENTGKLIRDFNIKPME